MFFNWGGSVSTVAFDIHETPKVLLYILLGVSTASMADIGFKKMVFCDSCEKKRALVAWKASEGNDKDNPLLFLEQLIFISDVLHGCSTTVWAALMKDPMFQKPQQWVIVKDLWIDPLQKFMEGNLLAKLNDANVKGMPLLIHKE